MQEICLQSLGQEDPLEKKMAIYSSILAWEIPWTKEWQATVHVLQRVRHDLMIKQLHTHTHTHTRARKLAKTLKKLLFVSFRETDNLILRECKLMYPFSKYVGKFY